MSDVQKGFLFCVCVYVCVARAPPCIVVLFITVLKLQVITLTTKVYYIYMDIKYLVSIHFTLQVNYIKCSLDSISHVMCLSDLNRSELHLIDRNLS